MPPSMVCLLTADSEIVCYLTVRDVTVVCSKSISMHKKMFVRPSMYILGVKAFRIKILRLRGGKREKVRGESNFS